MKKLLSICLAVLVVVGLMPVYALADDGDPIGDPTGGPDMTVYTVNAAATGGSISISSATATPGVENQWTVEAGTVINVTATANEGYELTALTAKVGDTAEQDILMSKSVKVDGNTAIRATFTKKPEPEPTVLETPQAITHKVNFTQPANGAIAVSVDGNTISNGASVEEGKTLSISAQPSSGDYVLKELNVTGAVEENGSYKMGTADVTISATFEAAQSNDALPAPAAGPHTVQASVSPTEGGSVTANPSSGTVNDNDPLTLTAAANPGYRLDTFAVTMGGVDQTVTNGTCTIAQVTGAIEATATFVKTHAVSLPSNPANGKVEVTGLNTDGTADDGKQITITATPNANYEVEQFNVTMGGTEQGSGNSRTISSVTGDVTVTATFKSIPVGTQTVKWSTNDTDWGNLEVTVDGNKIKSGDPVAEGKDIVINAVGKTGYVLDKLTVTGAAKKNDTTYTVGSSPVTISAIFKYDGSSASTPSYVYRPIGVYDDDGDWLEDNSGSSFPRPSSDGKVVLDGVLPNQTFYIKLGDAGNDYVTELSSGGKARREPAWSTTTSSRSRSTRTATASPSSARSSRWRRSAWAA